MPPRQGLRIGEDIRWQIVGLQRAGLSQTAISEQLGISQSSVSRTLQKHNNTGEVKDLERSGRPRKSTPRQDRLLSRLAVRDRWGHHIGRAMSRYTVRRRLRAAGIHSRRPRRGAVLTPRHKRARLQWAQARAGNNIRYWNRVRWSDESRFTLYHVDGRVRVWRRRGEEHLPECVLPAPQAFGGSVMVWGMMSGNTKSPLLTINGNLNGQRYRDEVLDVVVRPHFQQHRAQRPLFMDDNARPHRARLVGDFKQAQNITSLEWPALSPDLNPIEQAWDALQRAINGRQPPVATLQDLEQALHQEWARLPQRLFRNLVRSMPRRCQAVIQARGGHTRY
jgi:transposase